MAAARRHEILDAIFHTIPDGAADWLCTSGRPWHSFPGILKYLGFCDAIASRKLKQQPSLVCDSIGAPPCTADIGNRVTGSSQEPSRWNMGAEIIGVGPRAGLLNTLHALNAPCRSHPRTHQAC